eukprot:TRINITY_DN14115_c0_g1_i1.p1 TRINITY_DN14115_c0_g1~~TRINITY_DN14115_c0_g1_i1.p1  ORF type:complete len:349 (+),score=53.26 TRINITY_DN14115_c0_g1_i1:85-1131(+)
MFFASVTPSFLHRQQYLLVLNSVSFLEFCRVDFSAFNDLIQLLFAHGGSKEEKQEFLQVYLDNYYEYPHPAFDHFAASAPTNSRIFLSTRPVSLQDTVGIFRDFFHMGLFHDWMGILPRQYMEKIIMPLIFRYAEVPITGVNRRAFRLFAAALSQSDVAPLLYPMLPHLFTQLLKNHPSVVSVASVSVAYVALYHNLPPDELAFLYLTHLLLDKIQQILISTRQLPKQLTSLLLHGLEWVPLRVMPKFQDMIYQLLGFVTPAMRQTMLQLMFEILGANFDIVRKDIVLKWYLDLTRIDHPYPQPSPLLVSPRTRPTRPAPPRIVSTRKPNQKPRLEASDASNNISSSL